MSVDATNYAIRVCRLQDSAAKMVLVALAWKSHQETPHLVFIGNEQLRQETGLKSVNGVKNALRRLIAAGEVRIIAVGGRGQATNYELLGVRQWLESGEVSPFDISDGDSKVSPSDANCQMVTVKCRHLTPIDNKTIKTKDKGADAPAPAASQPSPPSLLETSVPPKSVSPPKPKKTPKLEVAESELELPHGEGFRRAWLQFMEHRRHPIRGRNVPLTKRAAELVLQDMAKINEKQACEAINMAIKTAWIVPYIDKYVQEPVNVAAFIPRTGPVQPSDAERRMLALEALQAQRMEGAA
jgi:hypothetical protein